MSWREFAIGIITILCTVAFSYGILTEKISTLEVRAQNTEVSLQERDKQYSEVMRKLSEIATDVKWLKNEGR